MKTDRVTDAAVEVRELTRSFGPLRVVNELSLSVQEGELFGLVGPDGAGKTTTLRMLAGVLLPSSGDASIFGVSVARDPEGVKHEIAYMSQRFGLYADLTVSENLRFYADLYQVPAAERPARLKRLFHFSGLEPFQGRLAGKLSGGMKQKLGLSCALIHHPRLLLLDEPSFGVDPISRRDLWLIVHEMVAEGVTVIVSTAYMDEAERFDRVALLHKGELLALQRPEELRGALAGRLAAVRASVGPREVRAAALEHPSVRHANVFGDEVHVGLGETETDGPSLESVLVRKGLTGVEVRAIEPTMEDVFIDRIRTADVGGGP